MLKTATDEAAFDAKVEKHFRSQRELPLGRDFRWNTYRYEFGVDKVRQNWDNIRWNSKQRCPSEDEIKNAPTLTGKEYLAIK